MYRYRYIVKSITTHMTQPRNHLSKNLTVLLECTGEQKHKKIKKNSRDRLEAARNFRILYFRKYVFIFQKMYR